MLDEDLYTSLMLPGDPLNLAAAVRLARPAWMAEAHCTNLAVEFVPAPARPDKPPSRAEQAAIRVCRTCPVRAECLEYALEHGELGVWGGTTETDRQRLLSQQGTTWADLSTDRRGALLAAAVTLRDPVQPSKACEAVHSSRPCEHCGEPASGRYCSPGCRSSASYYRRRAAPCEFCGGVTPKQYCSQECRVGAWEQRQAERASA